MKNLIRIIILSALFSNSNAIANWSDFIPSEDNISTLVELACAVDADKSLSASHTDNGVFLHEYQIQKNSQNQFEVIGECRIPFDQNMKRLAGDKISFIVDPSTIQNENKSIIQGYAGSWMFRFHSEVKEGAVYNGKRLVVPKIISYMSLSTSDLSGMSSIPGVGKIIQSAVEVMALSTDYQFTFQESTVWSSTQTNISIDAIMDRTTGGTLEHLSLRTLNQHAREVRLNSPFGYSFGNGIFFNDYKIHRGCTNLTTGKDVHFVNEETCRSWWSQLH